MPSFRRRASVTDTDKTKEPPETPDSSKALSLAEDAEAEAAEAEAEAAEAEATAAAARARARAIRLRRAAEAAASESRNGNSAKVETEPEAESEPEVGAQPVSEADVAVLDEPEDQPDEPEEASVEASAPSGRRWGLILKIVAMTLAVLCTAALVTVSVLMFLHHRNAVADQRMNAEYTAAGRQSVVTLMSLDFNKAEEDVKRIIDNSTGQFKTDFQNQAKDFIKVAQDSKVITDVTVTAAAVESMDANKAVVLVAATSRVTNSAGAKQEPRAWRLSVDLQREGDQIKMAKVEFVP